jgi:hypothetical protein
MLELPIPCDYCTRRFKKPESLGGHVAKAHPCRSKVYAKKIETRNQRAPDRELLKKAKNLLLEQYPGIDLMKNRAMVSKMKYELKKNLNKKQI